MAEGTGTPRTRREVIKGALRGGTYAAPVVLFLAAPSRVAALPSTASRADLTIRQVVDKPTPYLGEVVTVTVKNNGPDTATLTLSATVATSAPSTNTARITHLDETNPNPHNGASVLVTPLALTAAVAQTAACSGSLGLAYVERLSSLGLDGGPISAPLAVRLRYTGGDLDGQTSLFPAALTTDALGHAGLPAPLSVSIPIEVFQTNYPTAVTVTVLNGTTTVLSTTASLTTAPHLVCG